MGTCRGCVCLCMFANVCHACMWTFLHVCDMYMCFICDVCMRYVCFYIYEVCAVYACLFCVFICRLWERERCGKYGREGLWIGLCVYVMAWTCRSEVNLGVSPYQTNTLLRQCLYFVFPLNMPWASGNSFNSPQSTGITDMYYHFRFWRYELSSSHLQTVS